MIKGFNRGNFRTEKLGSVEITYQSRYVTELDNIVDFYKVIHEGKIILETTHIESAITVANLLLEIRMLNYKLKKEGRT